MPYGDTESNYYRLGEITQQIEYLKSELSSFKESVRFDISDMKEGIRDRDNIIEELRAEFDAKLKKEIGLFKIEVGDMFNTLAELAKRMKE